MGWLCRRFVLSFVAIVVYFAVQTVQAGSVDLGVVEAHRKVECGFAITNNTSTAWFVRGARSSCACMVVEVRQGELRAGEVLPVRVYTVWHEEDLRRGVEAHRDYSVRGAKIRLHMFADRLELVSPGSLPGTLTVDQMPYWQETRNEAICALLARCPMLAGVDGSTRRFLMDARGEGVPIIIARSERISGKKAEYRDIQGSGVMLTIPGFSDDLLTNSSENMDVSSENSTDSSANKVVSSKKKTVGEQVLMMIAADASVTQVAIAKKLHCPRSTVAYWFKKFADEGKIVREGPDKGGLWLVKE